MEHMDPMDDTEIQEKVESLVGKGIKVLDCEKSTSFQTTEVLLVNGIPVPLSGEEGARVKKALMTGQVPPGDLLNEILIRAGILKSPVELDCTMNVKSTTKTTELLTLRDKNGTVVDERMKEVEEDNEFQRESKEVWKKEDDPNEEELRKMGKRVERINVNIPPNSAIARASEQIPRTRTKTTSSFSSQSDLDEELPIRKETVTSTSTSAMAMAGTRTTPSPTSTSTMVTEPTVVKRHAYVCGATDIENVSSPSSTCSLISPEISTPNSTKCASSSSPPPSSCVMPLNVCTSTETRTDSAPVSVPRPNSLSHLLSPSDQARHNLVHPSISQNQNQHQHPNSNNNGETVSIHHPSRVRPTSAPPPPPSQTQNQNQNEQQLAVKTIENNVQLTYLDPSAGTLYAELNGVPVRVSYETFV